jgi:hypothetical protein
MLLGLGCRDKYWSIYSQDHCIFWFQDCSLVFHNFDASNLFSENTCWITVLNVYELSICHFLLGNPFLMVCRFRTSDR